MNIKLILKGFIVGVGKIIPGVSGSLLAFSLGIYESIIQAITNFFDNPKVHFKILLNFGLGVLIAIIVFSKLILYLLNHHYYSTMYLFLGLIIGTLIPFSKELKINKKTTSIFFLTLLFMLLINKQTNPNEFHFTGSIINYLYIAFLGLIDAFTSIIPGISGTAIFLMLGVYEFTLSILARPFCLEFLIYGAGIVLGIILICHIMNYLLKNKKEITYSIIFAFMISSIYILLSKIIISINIFFVLLLLIGGIIGFLFDK